MYIRSSPHFNGYQLTLSPQGFFTIYRNLFVRLAQEEKAFASNTEFPLFGDSTWTWTAPSKDRHTEAARHFYNNWLNFATEKDFAWMDQWNLTEAPDRRVRRYDYIDHLLES